MTHDELVVRATRWLRKTKGCGVVFAEIHTYSAMVPDAIGWKSGGGHCHLVECKTSRSDFKRDFGKPHVGRGVAPGNRRWYMTPPGLVKPDELPPGWGLVEAHEKLCRVVVDAPPMTGPCRDRKTEIQILFSACRRHRLGIDFNTATCRFKPAISRPAESTQPQHDENDWKHPYCREHGCPRAGCLKGGPCKKREAENAKASESNHDTNGDTT